MSTTEIKYAPVSSLAVASCILGGVCVLGLMTPLFAFFAVPGITFGVAAMAAIRKYELKGLFLAKAGLMLSLVFGIVSPIWAITVYEIRFRSEALPGYKRVNFQEIMEDRKNSENRLAALIGQNICFKGFQLIPSRGSERNSILVSSQRPSSGFGSKANLEETVLVKLSEGKFWQWRSETIAVSGTLIRNPNAQSDPAEPKFMLLQSEVFKALTLNGKSLYEKSGRGGC